MTARVENEETMETRNELAIWMHCKLGLCLAVGRADHCSEFEADLNPTFVQDVHLCECVATA